MLGSGASSHGLQILSWDRQPSLGKCHTWEGRCGIRLIAEFQRKCSVGKEGRSMSAGSATIAQYYWTQGEISFLSGMWPSERQAGSKYGCILKSRCVYVCAYMCTHVHAHVYTNQNVHVEPGTSRRSPFSSSTMWVPWIKLRLLFPLRNLTGPTTEIMGGIAKPSFLCSSWNENDPQRLLCSNAWLLVSWTVGKV